MIRGGCALVAALIMVIAPSAAAADGAGVADSLPAQVIQFHPQDHPQVLEAVARSRTRSDSLDRRAAGLITSSLSWLEGECRATLLSKDAEPGSPWLLWRSRGRVELDGCVWYAGALSCTDAVCGSELLLHDRLALLHVRRDRSGLFVLPPRAAGIQDGPSDVDSVAFIRGAGYVLVQARRRVTSEHPCYDGPDSQEATEMYFAVLRGDSVVQAFELESESTTSSHDDESGDAGADVRGDLVVTADAVQFDHAVEEWSESPDADPGKTKKAVTPGTVRFEYRPKTGRFVRVK